MGDDQIKTHAQSILDAVVKLTAENERLKAQCDDRWKHVTECGRLGRELQDAKRQLAETREEGERNWRDMNFWKKAVRYEQALKRPRKSVKHLPIYHSVTRAKKRNTPAWIGARTNAERIFLQFWRRENTRRGGLNGGRGTLEIILSEDNTVADLTQRDATVAATVVQWLGTNCGWAFIQEVREEIERQRKSEMKAKASA